MRILPNSEHLERVSDAALRATLGGGGRHSVPRIKDWYRMTTRSYFHRSVAAETEGNLKNDEYRFWIGSERRDASIAICRLCGSICMSPDERKRHQEGGCCKRLVSIYTEMLKARLLLCAVCNDLCADSRWGVPLHPSCVHDWKFSRQEFEGLEAYLRRAGVTR